MAAAGGMTPWDAFMEAHGLNVDQELEFLSFVVDRKGSDPDTMTRAELDAAWREYQRE